MQKEIEIKFLFLLSLALFFNGERNNFAPQLKHFTQKKSQIRSSGHFLEGNKPGWVSVDLTNAFSYGVFVSGKGGHLYPDRVDVLNNNADTTTALINGPYNPWSWLRPGESTRLYFGDRELIRNASGVKFYLRYKRGDSTQVQRFNVIVRRSKPTAYRHKHHK